MKTGKVKPGKGSILISEPFLQDANFKRSVIIITEHNTEGTVGYVLNRPIDVPLSQALTDFPAFDTNLYYGGPVQTDTLHFIHREGNIIEGSAEIVEGAYWGGNFESLRVLVDTNQIKPEDIRFYIGYSGWGPGQLVDEIKEKSWIVTPAKKEFLFLDDPANMWREILKGMGDEYAIISNFPEDPSLN